MSEATVGLLSLGAALLMWPVRSPLRSRIAALVAGGRLEGPPLTVRRLPIPALRASVVLPACGLVGALLVGPLLAVAGVAAAGAVVVPVREARAASRRSRYDADLLAALTVLVAELEVGTGLPQALAAARSSGRAAADVLEFEPPALGAQDRKLERRPAESLKAGAAHTQLFTAAAGVVAAHGVPWAAVVAGLARDVQSQIRRREEVDTVVAGVRASMLLLAVLPLVGLVLAAGLGAQPLGFLLGTPAGRLDLAVGTVLLFLGVGWTTRIAARAAA